MFKQTTEYKSIQKKLVAAVAMVLVAAIMVVSSSYAWFTLSTAPEVKGIQTSVGSNGNLEMALRTVANLEQISSLPSGGNSFPGANSSWGNLVDLRDSGYGLSEISLAPARLNVSKSEGATTAVTVTVTSTEGYYTIDDTYEGNKITEVVQVTDSGTAGEGETIFTSRITYNVTETTYTIAANAGYLWTAVYGTDGRVSALEQNTDIGIYDGTGFQIGNVGEDFGVKAIGVVSGLSDAELALRNAKNTVYSTIVEVTGDASTSLSRNASDLANILITYYLDENTTFGTTEWDQINDTLTEMGNMAKLLENALDQAVIAVGVYQGLTITDVSYTAGDIATVGGDINWDAEGLAAPYASLKAAYKDLADLNTIISNATTAMPAGGAGSYTYQQFESTFNYLMKTSDLTIHVGGKNYTVSEFKNAALENVTAIVTSGITVNITGGIYTEIAKFVGNYSGSAIVSADGSVIGDYFVGQTLSVPATLTTAVDAPSFHLVYANTWLPGLTVQGDNSAATSLTDLYAYMIDFAFRTNAAGSSLMLQTSAMDRVNQNNGAESLTQGAGSYMEFEIGTGDGYTIDQMLELMKAIRIVFIDDSNKVVAVAALDVSEFEAMKNSDNEETKAAYAALTKVNAPIYLYNFSFDANGVCELGTKITANDKGATALMELVQNTATGLSTLVYLDGDQVDNGDVAINGTSMTGTMNLQFSSSATLVPMDYTFEETEGEKLAAPTIALNEGVLTFADVPNASSYLIYVNGTPTDIPATSGMNLTTAMDAYGGEEDVTLSITVVAVGDGTTYTNSNPSNAVSVTIAAAAGI